MRNEHINDTVKALEKGIRRGKSARIRNRIIGSNLIAVVFIFLVFSVSVNLSTTFASSISGIPVLGKIADFVKIGSGFTEVAERGYFSQGEILVDDKDFVISIEGYYYSDRNLNVVIKVKDDLYGDFVYGIDNIELLDTEGNHLTDLSISYGSMDIKDGYSIGSIVANQKEGFLPEELTLKFDLTYSDGVSNETTESRTDILYENLSVVLKRQMIEENTRISINESIESNDITFTLESLLITPTVIELVVKIESEKMVFYGFDDIHFESYDKKYMLISNGLSGSMDLDNGIYTYFFESDYFDEDNQLTLVIDGLYALPIEYSTIIINLDTKTAVKEIDENLVLEKIEENDKEYILYFDIQGTGKIEAKSFNGHYFSSQAFHSNQYILYMEKDMLDDSMVEIDFYRYPVMLEFLQKLIIEK